MNRTSSAAVAALIGFGAIETASPQERAADLAAAKPFITRLEGERPDL